MLAAPAAHGTTHGTTHGVVLTLSLVSH